MSLLFPKQGRCSTLFIKYFARSRPTHGHRIIGRFGAWVAGIITGCHSGESSSTSKVSATQTKHSLMSDVKKEKSQVLGDQSERCLQGLTSKVASVDVTRRKDRDTFNSVPTGNFGYNPLATSNRDQFRTPTQPCNN